MGVNGVIDEADGKPDAAVISVAKAGAMLSVSHTAVQNAIKAGRLKDSVVWVNGKPKINADLIVAEWLKNTDQGLSQLRGNNLAERVAKGDMPKPPVKKSKARPLFEPVVAHLTSDGVMRAGEPRPQPLPQPVPAQMWKGTAPGTEDPTASKGPDLNTSKSVQALYAARTARLEYEQRAGKLVPVDAVKAEAFKTARTVRDAILNIPERLTPMLAAESEPAKIYALLVKEFTDALSALSGEADNNDTKPMSNAA
jgi:hypothetical protein